MTIHEITIDQLSSVVGGDDANLAAQIEDLRLEQKFQEKQQFTRWEHHHKLEALYCQGDRDCKFYR